MTFTALFSQVGLFIHYHYHIITINYLHLSISWHATSIGLYLHAWRHLMYILHVVTSSRMQCTSGIRERSRNLLVIIIPAGNEVIVH